MTREIRIGVNPIGWSNDDKRDLGGETLLETCLAEARLAGFAGIELGHKFPRIATELRPILQSHQLDLISGWYSSALLTRSVEEEIAALGPHLALLKALDCKVIIWAETTGAIHGDEGRGMSRRPVLSPAELEAFGGKLSKIAEHTLSQGMRLVYHHHMGTVIETEDEIEHLMAVTSPAVGLLLDTGHLAVAGGDAAHVARRFRSRIHHFHAKDVRRDVLARARVEDWSFLTAVVEGLFTVPGDGDLDFVTPLREIAADYHGWLVVEAEQDPMKANPLDYARVGYKSLRDFAREAGLPCP